MGILLIGLNHRTAPVEVREQIAFSREGTETALMLFCNQFPNTEAAIISTCNRVEMIVATEEQRPNVDDVVAFIAQARDLPVKNFRRYLYEITGEHAARHLFRVVSGLDSMVVGENQIISQCKLAYTQASEQGTTGRLLNRLFHQAFSTAKRIHTETEIGRRKVSMPSVAVDVATQIFSDLRDKRVLVIGAGEMARLVCQHLRDAEANQFIVASRTLSNARTLAQACDGQAVPFNTLDEQLAMADIVIAATACPRPFVTYDRVGAAMADRGGRPMFIIDLAVPRNVEAKVEEHRQVYVYDVDDLGKISAENQAHRSGQLELCEDILDYEVESLQRWMAQGRAAPLIKQMYSDAGDLCEFELTRFFNTQPDLTDDQRRAVRQLAGGIMNKLMHPCVHTLKVHSQAESSSTLAQALHEVVARKR